MDVYEGLPRSATVRLWLVVASIVVVAILAYNVREQLFLGDDCFISFRYARHLASGQGLVWNPGERVEGYTNFLWVVLMAGALKLGARPEIVSNLISTLSGGLLLAVMLQFSARLYGWRCPWIFLAPLILAGSRSFTAWCSGGLETMFFTLLVFGATIRFLSEVSGAPKRLPFSAFLFAAATLTRPEGALFASVAGLFLLVDVSRRKLGLRFLVVWSLALGLIVGTHLLWRHAYYGYWLPNTFTAKVPGAYWEQGWRYLRLFGSDYRFVWFLPLLPLALLLRRDRIGPLFLGMLAPYLLYVAYVGGDRFEFRFLVVVFPFAYWLLVDALRSLWNQTGGAGAQILRVVAVGAGAALLATSWSGSRGFEAGGIRHGIAGLDTIRNYASARAEEGKFLRGLIDSGKLPEGLVLCVGGAGALPYYAGLPTVDRRGLNDTTIARLPLAQRGIVAHERDAPYDYLVQRRVGLFDLFNGVVRDAPLPSGIPRTVEHDGMRLPVKIVRADGRYLVFVTLLSDLEFRKTFGRLQILQ